MVLPIFTSQKMLCLCSQMVTQCQCSCQPTSANLSPVAYLHVHGAVCLSISQAIDIQVTITDSELRLGELSGRHVGVLAKEPLFGVVGAVLPSR